jgi:hypothetical protein
VTSLATRSINFLFVGASLEPDELAASYPLPAAEGREWKYSGSGEGLAKDAQTDELPVLLDQLPVGLILEEHLRDAGDDEGIDQAEDYCGDDGVEDGGDEDVAHESVL